MTPQDSHQSESLWDLLSEELITEILTRLPSKPLCRFKSVSKRHNTLISKPHFITSYISSNSTPHTWAILDRIPQLAPESTQYATRFNILDLPEISTSSINPHKLAAKPITDTNRSKYPCLILQSSNGLLLCSLKVERDPHKEHERDPTSFSWLFEKESLYVVNPITHEWSTLPEPTKQTCNRNQLAFTTRVDPGTGEVDKFMLAGYQPVVGSEFAFFIWFSSDTGKWVDTSANYMLGNRHWRGDKSFEFEGRLFWVDLSAGLITWDNDPFVGMESKKAAVCRFIPLPEGCVTYTRTPGLNDMRCVGFEGGCIQYIQVFEEESCILKVWRLKDCESDEWSFKYKVSRDDVGRFLPCDLNTWMPRPLFVDPFQADVLYFEAGDYIFSFNFGTRKVETCSGFSGHEFVIPFVVPKWPSPLPKRMYAAYAKEEGNEYFKSHNFTEAIKCYSKSIALSPSTVALANRAMAYLKVSKFCEAENDCTESLKLDANYFKVYCRRAIARKELGDLKGAMEDAELGMKLEPDNGEVHKLCAEVKIMLEKDCFAEQENDVKGEACDTEFQGK